jgi:hypothetical protein
MKITITPIPKTPLCKVWVRKEGFQCGKPATCIVQWDNDITIYHRCTKHVKTLIQGSEKYGTEIEDLR